MRRLTAWLMIMMMVFIGTACADGTGKYLMAGYDSTDSGHEWETNAFFPRMEKITGVSFALEQYKDAEAWTEAKGTLLDGSDNMPDVLFKAQLTGDEMTSLYEKGMLIDLKPYLAEYAPNLTALLQAHPEWEAEITLPGGQIVALPTINELPANNVAWINTMWLKNVKMEMPTTVEELTDVLRAFRDQDPNQNGRSDEIPVTFTSLWDLRYLGQAFGMLTNDYYLRAKDGKIEFMADSEENHAFLTWLHQLWQEGLIDQNGFTSLDTMRAITDKDAAITYGIVFGATAMNLVPPESAINYAALMPMRCNGEDGKWRQLQSQIVRGTFAITSHCANPGEVLTWVDYLYSDEGDRLMQAGLPEEEYFVNADGTWEYIDSGDSLTQVLQNQAIVGGGDTPGWFSADFQMKFNDSATHYAVEQLYQVQQVSVMPVPQIWLTTGDRSRINGIWAEMGYEMELDMVHFVTGDAPLNDETWAAFCAKYRTEKTEELVAVWQDALDR